MPRNLLIIRYAFFILLAFSGCQVFYGSFSWSSVSDAKQAEALAAEDKYDEAVKLYERHIEKRLANKNRPEDENPYFYKIMIGDVYLKAKRPKEAEVAFEQAMSREVELPLVIDRFRKLGKFYSDRGRFQEALDIFKKYRNLDPFVFDIEIDETHKAMVEEEDLNK